jgi:hypothetical protein
VRSQLGEALRQIFAHTHLVRGGSVMLCPTICDAARTAGIPTSSEVGP